MSKRSRRILEMCLNQNEEDSTNTEVILSPVEVEMSPNILLPELLSEIPIVEYTSAHVNEFADNPVTGYAEEKEDFSFSQNSSNDDKNYEPENNENTPKCRPKKGRKRKFGNMLRSERKIQKYTNKEYVNYKGQLIIPKEFRDFNCDCVIICKELVSTDVREEEFKKFWELGSYLVKQLEGKITNRKKSTTGESINWLKTREIILNKNEPFTLKMKRSFEDDDVQVVNIEKRGTGRKPDPKKFHEYLEPLWPHGKAINPQKLKNLQEMLHLISEDAKPFYMALVSDNQVEDDLDGFGVPPDFDLVSFEND